MNKYFSCCQKDEHPLDHVPTLCFERNDCPGLHWLGKDACASHMLNAINDKKLGNSEVSVRIFSPEFFELKEINSLLKVA